MTDELKMIIELTSESAARKAADCAYKKMVDYVKDSVPKDIDLAIVDHEKECPAVKSTALNIKAMAIIAGISAVLGSVVSAAAQLIPKLLQ